MTERTIGFHFHRWTEWQDVDLGEKMDTSIYAPYFLVVRQVIKQQRRCLKCNMVETRHT